MAKSEHLRFNASTLKKFFRARELYLVGIRGRTELQKRMRVKEWEAEAYLNHVRRTLKEEATMSDLDEMRAEIDAQYMSEIRKIDKEIRAFKRLKSFKVVDGKVYRESRMPTQSVCRLYELRASILHKRAVLWGLISKSVHVGDKVLGDKITSPQGKRIMKFEQVNITKGQKNGAGGNGKPSNGTSGNGKRIRSADEKVAD